MGDVIGGGAARSTTRQSRRNYACAAWSGALVELGSAFSDSRTVVATFLTHLTPSALAIGAADAILRFGSLAPQLFVANYCQPLRYRKSVYLFGSGLRTTCLGLLALILILGLVPRDSVSPGRTLTVFFVLWTLFSIGRGVIQVPYNDIVGRTVPSGQRSRLLATRYFVGGALGAVAGLLIRLWLGDTELAWPTTYGVIFGVAALVLAVATLFFAGLNEPAAAGRASRPRFRVFLGEGLDVLKHDPKFRRFAVSQLLGGLTTMALPFYILQARQVSRLAEAEVGTLIAAQMIGTVAFNPIWGWWGDARGKLSLVRLLAWVGIGSPMLALLGPSVTGDSRVGVLVLYAVIFLLGSATATGGPIAEVGYLMEISPGDRRAEYSGYMNALVAPSRLLPVLGSLLIDFFSFSAVFAVAVLSAIARLSVLTRIEPDPSI